MLERWRTVSGHDFESWRTAGSLDIRALAPAAAKAAGRNVALRHGSKPCPDTTPRSKETCHIRSDLVLIRRLGRRHDLSLSNLIVVTIAAA